MRIETETVGKMRNVRVAYFDNAADLGNYVKTSKESQKFIGEMSGERKWAGGSPEYFFDACKRGDVSFAKLADKYVDKFANLALADYDVAMDYNTQVGVLDYQAALAGDPMCMFGPTVTETNKSPVNIYVDCWTSSSVSPEAMQARGITVLALTMALSVFRPVHLYTVTGLHHSPTRTDVVQVCRVPTAPMDLSLVSWMLGSPTFFRIGQLGAVWPIAGSDAWCGLPRLSDDAFQATQLGPWLAAKDGVHDEVFLPLMFDNGKWNDPNYALAWIKEQLEKFT